MEMRPLGQTGLEVTRLCFGSLALSPLQRKWTVREGGELLCYACEQGLNFIDTAQYYQNYDIIKEVLVAFPQTVLCSKTYAYKADDALRSVEDALRGINRDYIDIFMLHEQESASTLAGHAAALEALHRCKEQGKIRAVGVSTHHVAGVLACVNHPLIEVVHPLINRVGLGIVDGSAAQMLMALKRLSASGKGIYAMKALGGGNLHHSVYAALDYVLAIDELDAIAIGMQTRAEIDANIQYFTQGGVNDTTQQQVEMQHRQVHIAKWCVGCGQCVGRCSQGALTVHQGQAQIHRDKCLLCGYCSPVCPHFCIRIF